jgi:hypothetical protein
MREIDGKFTAYYEFGATQFRILSHKNRFREFWTQFQRVAGERVIATICLFRCGSAPTEFDGQAKAL